MSIAIKAGARLKSAVCDTQVMVIKTPGAELELCCGGQPMLAMDGEGGGEPAAEHSSGTLMGKRYVNADESLELLCTKPGKGSLSLGGAALEVKQAKQLPSSD